jgi:hypothetical protein
MPNTTARNKISTNLSKLGSFFYNEFPNNPNFIPQNIDPAKIQIYGKDMNITHSTTTGFGNDQNIYFNYTTPNFSRIQFDVNTSAGNLTQLSAPSFPSCSGCQYPVLLIINVRNSAGSLVYSFNSIVDINKNGVLDLNSTPTSPDLQLRYSPKLINWQTNSSSINLLTQINFNDPYLEIGIDKAAIRIDEMSSFGVQG